MVGTYMVTVVIASIAVLVGSLAAIRCFEIKYADKQQYTKLEEELNKVLEFMKHLDTESIEALTNDVKVLKNAHNIRRRG